MAALAHAHDFELRTAEQEFDFSGADFDRVRGLIHAHAGIALNPSKRSMVYSRLSRRLRAVGSPTFEHYLDDVERAGRDSDEWQQFVNALTTNLTSFFREAHHFPVLAQHLLRNPRDLPQRIWCCAASTGEEPYTIAMTAIDAFGRRDAPVQILATDIDTGVLEKAKRGVYPADAVEKLDRAVVRRHFLRGRGDNDALVKVRPDLAAPIAFRALNLLDETWPVKARFDAIFCRNVMIYFDKATQRDVLAKLAARLKPDGLLFAGHSENFTQARDLFTLQGKTVYRLAAGAGNAPAAAQPASQVGVAAPDNA